MVHMSGSNKTKELKQMLHLFRIRRNDSKYRDMVINGYNNSDYVKIEHNGDMQFGRIVYEISEYGRNVGFFAEVLYLLIELYYADERGFLPYVSWGGNYLYYDSDNLLEDNAFAYYFSPVSEITKNEFDNAAFYIKSDVCHIQAVQNELNTHGYIVSDEYLDGLAKMFQKYIKYNSDTDNYLTEEFNRLIGTRKALAVHYRGTDFKRGYNNHPTYVCIEDAVSKVSEIFEKGGYEIVFLATDEQSAIDVFSEALGNKLVYYKDSFRSKGGDESIAFSSDRREHHHYLLGLEVLRDEYTLAKCVGLVCGISNITLTAQIMKRAWGEEYSDLVILNSKLNHNNNKFINAKH